MWLRLWSSRLVRYFVFVWVKRISGKASHPVRFGILTLVKWFCAEKALHWSLLYLPKPIGDGVVEESIALRLHCACMRIIQCQKINNCIPAVCSPIFSICSNCQETKICSNEERCVFFSSHVGKPVIANISVATVTRKCTNLLLSSSSMIIDDASSVHPATHKSHLHGERWGHDETECNKLTNGGFIS